MRILRSGLFIVIAVIAVSAFYVGSASARSTKQFSLQMTMVGLPDCVNVGDTITYGTKVVNTSRKPITIHVEAYGMDGSPYTLQYVSSTPALTTVVHTYTEPGGSTYTYDERYWDVVVKPKAKKLLRVTATVPDWDVVPPNVPPGYTPQPYPIYTGFDATVLGQTNDMYVAGSSPYCGLTPPPPWGGK